MWTAEHDIVCGVPPQTIWNLFRDVNGWGRWNAGIESIRLEGDFAVGQEFTMQPPGQDAFRSRLIEVVENERFVDETRLGDVVVRVAHRIEGLTEDRTRIVYATEVDGPDAAEIGRAVSADFPQVLAALVRLAEGEGAE